MKRIMLLCSAGMSTSLLVQKMQQAASEEGFDCEIWASAEADAKKRMEEVDVILLGPQVRFLKDRLQKDIGARDIKLDVINPVDYGRMNGSAVLGQAKKLLNME